MNIPLIVDKKLENIYDLKGVISYDKSINEVIDSACNISNYVHSITIIVIYVLISSNLRTFTKKFSAIHNILRTIIVTYVIFCGNLRTFTYYTRNL